MQLRTLTLAALAASSVSCATGSNYEQVYGELTRTKRAMRASAAEHEATQEEMTAALAALREENARTEALANQYRDLLAGLQGLIDAGQLSVKIVDGRMILQMPSDVLFDSASAELSDQGRRNILQVSGILAAVPDKKLQIAGHTDALPINTEEFPDNWHLAAARAMGVLNTMLEAGVSGKRLSAASFGEHQPVASNRTESGRRTNRRIEIMLLPDLSHLQDKGLEEALSQR